jgi:hypothetical protein
MDAGRVPKNERASAHASSGALGEEIPMQKIAGFLLGVAAVAAPAILPAVAQSSTDTVVMVFKDGHRQTVKAADLERIEFSGPVPAGLLRYPGPSRQHYLGKWEVGEGNGENFFITLRDDGTAVRSLGDERGAWQYVNGEAEVRWNDGSNDCIRKVGAWYKKYWYKPDQAFNGDPENVTDARNVTENPRGVD